MDIEFTRINNDTYGNPRYVCHFLTFIKSGEFDNIGTTNADGSGFTSEQVIRYVHKMDMLSYKYQKALDRSRQFGGRKFHNKQYGGGIVFQSYNIDGLGEDIEKFVNSL